MIASNLPDNARVWVYQSVRKLTTDEIIHLGAEMNMFADAWTSHKVEVPGEAHLLHNRFIILLADEEQVKLGGCSIDSSVRFVKQMEQKFNTNFFDRQNIAYKMGKEVNSCPLIEFEQLMRNGTVTDETIVFNNLVQNKNELLTKWEVPFKDSWHKNLAVSRTSFNSVL